MNRADREFRTKGGICIAKARSKRVSLFYCDITPGDAEGLGRWLLAFAERKLVRQRPVRRRRDRRRA